MLHFGLVAAVDVDVLRGDFAEHVGKDVVEIGAAHDVVDIGLVAQ